MYCSDVASVGLPETTRPSASYPPSLSIDFTVTHLVECGLSRSRSFRRLRLQSLRHHHLHTERSLVRSRQKSTHTRPHTPSQSLSSQWLASRDTLRAIPEPCSTVRRTLLRWQGDSPVNTASETGVGVPSKHQHVVLACSGNREHSARASATLLHLVPPSVYSTDEDPNR